MNEYVFIIQGRNMTISMSLSRSSLLPAAGSFSGVGFICSILAQSACLSATSLCYKTVKYCIELSKQEYHLLGSESTPPDLLSTAKSSGSVCHSVHCTFGKLWNKGEKSYLIEERDVGSA